MSARWFMAREQKILILESLRTNDCSLFSRRDPQLFLERPHCPMQEHAYADVRFAERRGDFSDVQILDIPEMDDFSIFRFERPHAIPHLPKLCGKIGRAHV